MPELNQSQRQQIEAMLQANRKIEAIKLCREFTGLGLKESKDFVDEFEAELRRARPEQFAQAPKSGCASMLLLCAAALIAAAAVCG